MKIVWSQSGSAMIEIRGDIHLPFVPRLLRTDARRMA
jgi:hypothetical protein